MMARRASVGRRGRDESLWSVMTFRFLSLSVLLLSVGCSQVGLFGFDDEAPGDVISEAVTTSAALKVDITYCEP